MKQVFYFVLVGMVAGLSGCGVLKSRQPDNPVDPNLIAGVPVVIEGGGEFPDFLTGIWVQEGPLKRAFYFENGCLDMMILGIARAPVKPHSRVEIPLIEGGVGKFTSGKWFASYNPQTRELAVEIVIESFSLVMPRESLAGSIREVYIGKISEDGTRWDVDYEGYPYFIVNTSTFKDHVLHRPEEVVEDTLVFTKYAEPKKEL